MAERARIVSLSPIVATGDEVIVYRRLHGVIDEESLRTGHVLDVVNGEARIMFAPSYDEGASKYVSTFGAVPNGRHFKARSWDVGLPERVFFATLDEEFL